MFAELALPTPLDRLLTYRVPALLEQRAQVGMRAVVPLQGRFSTGYVVALTDACELDPKAVRALIDMPDEGPVFSQSILDLCAWMAQYYCCSYGEALHAALPAGLRLRARIRWRLNLDALGPGRFTNRQRKVIAELNKKGPLSEPQMARAVGATALSSTLQALAKRGIVVPEPVEAEQGVRSQTELFVKLAGAEPLDTAQIEALQRRAPRQAAVYLDLVHGMGERPAAHLYEKHKADRAVLRALEKKGLVACEERDYYRIPEMKRDAGSELRHALNDEQQAAYDAAAAALEAGRFQTFLLEGVTGSGKTEVYLQVVERALELGRDAIILVPEISLTPQTVGRFKARFDADIAVMHSGLSAGERYDEWRRAHEGKVRIVVGARSAIFAPLPKVGLIVVDEEHDTSYKQTEVPRYHARDVAIMRAHKAGAVCMLGSATPGLESRHNAAKGKSVHLRLTRRATKAQMPTVKVVDMRKEKRQEGGDVALSQRLEAAIGQRLKAGEQVLVLLNRRGHAPFVLCPTCGWVAECGDCQVSLTFHSKGGYLACHYCNARRDVPGECETCGFKPLLFLGTGTQKIEDYLVRSFPKARIERMDADTTAGKGGHAKILGRLAAREIDLLVGTQMIAKGHDYPGVTLVGVVNADAGLALPDFRAAENVFQLITQVAGRAGRAHKPGEVIIQTFRPNHYALRYAAAQDYAGFFEEELRQREAAGYPPFTRMVNLALESEDVLEVERAAARLYRAIREQREELGLRNVALLGPAPASIRRIRKYWRWNTGILHTSPSTLNRLVRAVREHLGPSGLGSGVSLKIDFDPYGLF